MDKPAPAVAGPALIEKIHAAAYTVPTDRPESDGTIVWNETTLVLVEITAGGVTGLGYTYADRGATGIVLRVLARLIEGRDADDIPALLEAMEQTVRNKGRPGLIAMAMSAVDSALWDLKARRLNLPLVKLLGAVRPSAPVYGSGGFTSYSLDELKAQLGHWAEQGIRRVKMKVGRAPAEDPGRVRAAREVIGEQTALFVDANGAFTRKQALLLAEAFATSGVSWFEEPVSSDDLEGLHLLVERAPPGMAIAAGEYGDSPWYFARMLRADAVDVLQADATRCLGVSGFMRAAGLCDAFQLPLSAHCAPALHASLCCAVPRLAHLEYFHDHVRIEQLFFDGVLRPRGGALFPDLSRPGFGLEFKRKDAARFQM